MSTEKSNVQINNKRSLSIKIYECKKQNFISVNFCKKTTINFVLKLHEINLCQIKRN